MKAVASSPQADNRFAFPPSLVALRRQLDRLLDEFADGGSMWGADRPFAPRADYAETDSHIVITTELPGVDPQDVQITLEDDALSIRGQKRIERNEATDHYELTERGCGAFERVLPVPRGIDAEKVTAKLDRGVLHVTLPKPAAHVTSRKEIKIGP